MSLDTDGKWKPGAQDSLPHSEKIAIVRAGGRVDVKMSLHKEEREGECRHRLGWRTIACDGELDIVECPRCGKQEVAVCNFDEDFA